MYPIQKTPNKITSEESLLDLKNAVRKLQIETMIENKVFIPKEKSKISKLRFDLSNLRDEYFNLK